MDAKRPDAVLVLRLTSLGDVLFVWPSVHALLKSQPGQVAWLGEDRVGALLDLFPGLEEVMLFPRRELRRWPGHVRRLRARRDDVILDVQGSLKSRLQMRFLRAPRRVGFVARIAREGAERDLTEAVDPGEHRRHKVDLAGALVEALGVATPRLWPRPPLAIPDSSHARIGQQLPGRGPLVVLHPGTSAFGAFKRWDPERLAQVGDALARSHAAQLVVTGTPDEQDLVDAVRAGLRTPDLHVACRSIADLAALLSAAQLLIAADSFPLHLANLLGTPVVGLYGPKDPDVTGPYWDRSAVVRAAVACSPCTLRHCADRLCMERLAVSAVTRAAQGLLDEHS